jgi:hypothetical protein
MAKVREAENAYAMHDDPAVFPLCSSRPEQ